MKIFRVRIKEFEYDTFLSVYVLAPNSEKALEIAKDEHPWIESKHINNDKHLEFVNNVKYWRFDREQKDNLIVEEINLSEQRVIAVEDNLH